MAAAASINSLLPVIPLVFLFMQLRVCRRHCWRCQAQPVIQKGTSRVTPEHPLSSPPTSSASHRAGLTDPVLQTSALDRLAREGRRFTRFYCPNPTCSPATFALITGMYPAWHGCWGHRRQLPEDVPTVGEQFQANGVPLDPGRQGALPAAQSRSRERVHRGASRSCATWTSGATFTGRGTASTTWRRWRMHANESHRRPTLRHVDGGEGAGQLARLLQGWPPIRTTSTPGRTTCAMR